MRIRPRCNILSAIIIILHRYLADRITIWTKENLLKFTVQCNADYSNSPLFFYLSLPPFCSPPLDFSPFPSPWNGKIVWVTCGLWVVLAFIYSKPHSCTLPELELLSVPAARAHVFLLHQSTPAQRIRISCSAADCLLLCLPRKAELPPASFMCSNVSFKSNCKLTF